MKNIIKYLPVTLLGAALFSGCYKDEGNYSYKNINEISVVNNDSATREVYRYDSLVVIPEFKATIDKNEINTPGRYSFLWVANSVSGTVSSGYTPYTLSSGKDLRIKVALPEGKYRLSFEMTDSITGNIYTGRLGIISVISSTYEGWLVLCDVNGNTRLDMINILKDKPETHVTDILSTSADLPSPLKGPRDVSYISSNYANVIPAPSSGNGTTDKEWIYVSTDQGTWKLRGDNLSTQWKWNSWKEMMMPGDSVSYIPGFYGINGSNLNTNNVYMYDGKGNYYMRPADAFFFAPYNMIQGEAAPFKAAPFQGQHFVMSKTANGVLFDTEKKRFVRHVPTAANCTVIPYNAATMPLFDFNNVGMDLVWMKNTPGTTTYAVMQDEAGDRWLLTFDISGDIRQDRKVKLTGPDVRNATKFALDRSYGTLFYATESKVYATSKDFPEQTYEVLNLGNKKITILDQHLFNKSKYTSSDPLTPGNWLIVGYYDPAGPASGNGTVAAFSPAAFVTSHATLTKMREYTGFGKPVSYTYRERN